MRAVADQPNAGTHMQGRRVYADGLGNMPLSAGEYGQLGDYWWVCPPRGGTSAVPQSRVLEHEDSTITVEGDLQLRTWQGRLERGVWKEALADD